MTTKEANVLDVDSRWMLTKVADTSTQLYHNVIGKLIVKFGGDDSHRRDWRHAELLRLLRQVGSADGYPDVVAAGALKRASWLRRATSAEYAGVVDEIGVWARSVVSVSDRCDSRQRLREIKKAAYDLGCGYTAEDDPEVRAIKEALFNLGSGHTAV